MTRKLSLGRSLFGTQPLPIPLSLSLFLFDSLSLSLPLFLYPFTPLSLSLSLSQSLAVSYCLSRSLSKRAFIILKVVMTFKQSVWAEWLNFMQRDGNWCRYSSCLLYFQHSCQVYTLMLTIYTKSLFFHNFNLNWIELLLYCSFLFNCIIGIIQIYCTYLSLFSKLWWDFNYLWVVLLIAWFLLKQVISPMDLPKRTPSKHAVAMDAVMWCISGESYFLIVLVTIWP